MAADLTFPPSTNRQRKRMARALAKELRRRQRLRMEDLRQIEARGRRPAPAQDMRLTVVPYTRFPDGDRP